MVNKDSLYNATGGDSLGLLEIYLVVMNTHFEYFILAVLETKKTKLVEPGRSIEMRDEFLDDLKSKIEERLQQQQQQQHIPPYVIHFYGSENLW